jgi:DNA-damage-inducible protein J
MFSDTHQSTERDGYHRCLGYNVAQTSPEDHALSENTVVRACIDAHIKEEASTVLAAIGLTVSDAFRILLTRIAREKALPFEPLVPNETTIAAMRDGPRRSPQGLRSRRGTGGRLACEGLSVPASSSATTSEKPRGTMPCSMRN